MKNIFKFSLHFFILLVLVSPVLSLAQNDAAFEKGDTLVPCGTETKTKEVDDLARPGYKKEIIEVTNPCKFNHLIIFINNLIRWILVYLAVPIAAIVFMYAGFQLIFSGGDTHKRSEAKNMFFDVVKGLVLIAGAWLIINAILSILGYKGASFFN